MRHRRQRLRSQCADSGTGPGRVDFANQPPHFLQARFLQRLLAERRGAGEQFIKQHTQRINVAARVDIQAAHLRLFGAHVQRRADHLCELGEQRPLTQFLIERLGDAEVDHFHHRHPLVKRDHHIRGLDVTVDDAPLMGVLDRAADVDEQPQPVIDGEPVLVAVVGDRDASDQFHHKVGMALKRGPGVQDAGDVGMIHHRQRLPLGLKPRDHFTGVHTGFDQLECYLSLERVRLLGQEHGPHPTLADLFEQRVTVDGRMLRNVELSGYALVGCSSLYPLGGFVSWIELFEEAVERTGRSRITHGQKPLNVVASFDITSASLLQKRLSLPFVGNLKGCEVDCLIRLRGINVKAHVLAFLTRCGEMLASVPTCANGVRTVGSKTEKL